MKLPLKKKKGDSPCYSICVQLQLSYNLHSNPLNLPRNSHRKQEVTQQRRVKTVTVILGISYKQENVFYQARVLLYQIIKQVSAFHVFSPVPAAQMRLLAVFFVFEDGELDIFGGVDEKGL